MKSYRFLAQYYDKFSNKDCDYKRWSQYLFVLADKFGVQTVADIACGTGKMTVLLSKNGYKTVGVDVSEEMLSVAQSKPCKATFVCQDMCKLHLPNKVDMITCVNDGANYVKQDCLSAFFATVADNLRDGGVFAFDTSSCHKYQNVLSNNVFFVDEKDVTLLWRNSLVDNVNKMELTFFVKDGKNYTRLDETHTQYVHTVKEVQNALDLAGFDLAEITSDYGLPYSETGLRTTFVAIKRTK